MTLGDNHWELLSMQGTDKSGFRVEFVKSSFLPPRWKKGEKEGGRKEEKEKEKGIPLLLTQRSFISRVKT